jgi:hypothetical protein
MKKPVIALLLFLLSLGGFAKGLDFIRHGEYAIYSDTRGSSNFLRGYWLGRIEDAGHCLVVSINRNLKTGQQLVYFVELAEGGDGLPEIVKVDGIGDKTPPEFRQSLADFMNYVTLYLKHESEIGLGSAIDDPWEGYTLEFNFSRLLPFFRFSEIRMKGQEDASYVLDSSGILEFSELKSLVKKTLVGRRDSDRSRGIADLSIPSAQALQVTMNGLSTTLDELWVYNDSLGSPGYWLPLNGVRDSQIAVEKIPTATASGESLPAEEICRLCILTTAGVLYSSVQAREVDGMLYVAYTTYDDEGIKNYQVFILREMDGYFLGINFSTFADIYDQNPDYYKKIIAELAGN